MARFSSVWTSADLGSQHHLAQHKARVHFLKGFRDDSFMQARISRDNPMAAPPPIQGKAPQWWGGLGHLFYLHLSCCFSF